MPAQKSKKPVAPVAKRAAAPKSSPAAKSAGKACVRVWSEDLDPSALRPG